VAPVRFVVIAVAAVVVACSGRSVTGQTAIGFWYEPDAFTLPADMPCKVAGSLTANDRQAIEELSRAEITRAFVTLNVRLTNDRHAFWRVQVLPSLPARINRSPRQAGESLTLGIFGGAGGVGFDAVALLAAKHASPAASRAEIMSGIGRGIGRVAIHELTHQMLLGGQAAHNDRDADSYEYTSPDRASQYYGVLHWTTALPLLAQKYGR